VISSIAFDLFRVSTLRGRWLWPARRDRLLDTLTQSPRRSTPLTCHGNLALAQARDVLRGSPGRLKSWIRNSADHQLYALCERRLNLTAPHLARSALHGAEQLRGQTVDALADVSSFGVDVRARPDGSPLSLASESGRQL